MPDSTFMATADMADDSTALLSKLPEKLCDVLLFVCAEVDDVAVVVLLLSIGVDAVVEEEQL